VAPAKGREAQAQAAAWHLVAAACRGMKHLWDTQEQLHTQASDQAEAEQAAAPLLRVCSWCPITAECRAWARADSYTGIAAGTAWSDGKERSPHWVPGHPPRKLAS